MHVPLEIRPDGAPGFDVALAGGDQQPGESCRGSRSRSRRRPTRGPVVTGRKARAPPEFPARLPSSTAGSLSPDSRCCARHARSKCNRAGPNACDHRPTNRPSRTRRRGARFLSSSARPLLSIVPRQFELTGAANRG
jgi:hypothetical protein